MIFLYLEQTVRTVAGEKLLKDGEQDDAGDADTGHDDHAVRGGLGILPRCKKSSALEHNWKQELGRLGIREVMKTNLNS